MAEYFEKNLELITRRWPDIAKEVDAADPGIEVIFVNDTPQTTLQVNGVHLSSCFDSKKEACLQARQVPETSDETWLYGVGVGDLPREMLKREQLKRLNVVLLNVSVFNASLACFDHSDWLMDDRICLWRPRQQQEINTPFAVVPAELVLADQSSARLRDLLVLELETEFINANVRSNKQFLKQIEENYKLVKRDANVKDLFDTFSGKEVFVCAAGPTLEECFSYLKSCDRSINIIIAVDAALKPLLANDINPDIVITIDGNRDSIYKMFDFDLTGLQNTPLVYFPIVHSDVLQRWPGPRYTAYSTSPIYESISQKISKGFLFAAGTVTHAAVDLAVKIGGRRICLMGADFSFPGRQSHVAGSVFCQKMDDSDCKEVLLDGYGRKVNTTKNLRGYLRDLERYIAQQPQVQFINASRSGALIEGVDYLDLI